MNNLKELGATCQRIEDSLRAGIPDINVLWAPGGYNVEDLGASPTPTHYRTNEGWIEFKFVSKLPKRELTPVRIGLRKEQKVWLILRAKAGGRACVITKVEPTRLWLVHTGHYQALYEGMPIGELCDSAAMCWTGDFKSRAHEVLKLILG
jgi:hypothetical protein